MRRILRVLAILLISSASFSGRSIAGDGGFAGVTNCFIGGRWVTVKGNCPASGGGSGGGAASGSGGGSAAYNGFYGASYQLGYAFGQWLFGSGSNPQAEQQKRLMMEELQRRQAEAERQHREEEARRLAAMYNRLATTLKLSGVPDLQIKESSGGGSGLKLKLGDGAEGHAGIKGLPGIYLKDGKVPYGIPGLPGIYTGGPGEGSGLTASGLKLKTGDGSGPGAQAAAAPATAAAPAQVAAASLPDPAGMTPQQMADIVEMVSQLPPEAQQELLAAAQSDIAAGGSLPRTSGPLPEEAPAAPQRQAAVSQAAASAATPEDASDKARAGFDRPIGQGTETPSPGAAATPGRVPASAPPAATDPAPVPQQSAEDLVKLYLFTAGPLTGPFPGNPDPPLGNPLRDEQRLQAELKAWDDWAVSRAKYINGKSDDPLYPASMERDLLNAATVKDYAPDLFGRYKSDPSFRREVDRGLESVTGKAALDYYQGQAEAHKAAIRAFQLELEKLSAAGKLDRLVPLEDQYRLHPERRQLVEEVRNRLAADEQAAVEKARDDANRWLSEAQRHVLQLIRGREAHMEKQR